MAEEGTGGRGRGERGGRRKGPEREGEGRKREGPMTLWHGAPQCLNPALVRGAIQIPHCDWFYDWHWHWHWSVYTFHAIFNAISIKFVAKSLPCEHFIEICISRYRSTTLSSRATSEATSAIVPATSRRSLTRITSTASRTQRRHLIEDTATLGHSLKVNLLTTRPVHSQRCAEVCGTLWV